MHSCAVRETGAVGVLYLQVLGIWESYDSAAYSARGDDLGGVFWKQPRDVAVVGGNYFYGCYGAVGGGGCPFSRRGKGGRDGCYGGVGLEVRPWGDGEGE
jgi:hypothetical protein